MEPEPGLTAARTTGRSSSKERASEMDGRQRRRREDSRWQQRTRGAPSAQLRKQRKGFRRNGSTDEAHSPVVLRNCHGASCHTSEARPSPSPTTAPCSRRAALLDRRRCPARQGVCAPADRKLRSGAHSSVDALPPGRPLLRCGVCHQTHSISGHPASRLLPSHIPF